MHKRRDMLQLPHSAPICCLAAQMW
jgi:hypothetical protein